jgi:F-type H+-transporting ATPase subunit b
VLINWFTVCAQIVNFVVLVALLKHFLYGPIIRSMDAREQKIADRVAEAERKNVAAEQAEKNFREKNREIAEKSAGMLSMAKADADARRSELIQQARQEVSKQKTGWQEAVQKEQEAFIRNLRQIAGSQIYAISRRALVDICSASVEERAADVFLAKILNLTPGDRQKFSQAADATGSVLTVRSAFPLSRMLRHKLTTVVHTNIVPGAKISYETSPELILGFELITQGCKISWNLDDYLKVLEARAREALSQKVYHTGG